MISSWKATAALLLLAGVLSIAWTINHYRNNAITFKDQRDKATVRANSSEAITNNVITAINLIRDISQATQNAKNELAEKGETRIVYIRQTLEGDSCAKRPVPSAAADSLREYANNLRSRSSGTDKR
jgi:prophage endopeptidase